MKWQLWQASSIERYVDGISPLLASWEKSSHPAQVRLRAYLDSLASKLLPLPENEPLFLQLDVDVELRERLLRHYDLENYLTPLFGSRCLPSSRFVLVKARKYIGGGSRIAWGKAIPSNDSDNEAWSGFMVNAGHGASGKAWKERIRCALEASQPTVIEPGPVKVRLAWRCASQRNWSGL